MYFFIYQYFIFFVTIIEYNDSLAIQLQKIKAEKLAIDEKYGWCVLDGRKEKVGNFRIEPPGLFRGRGEHPKTGCLKVNCSSIRA